MDHMSVSPVRGGGWTRPFLLHSPLEPRLLALWVDGKGPVPRGNASWRVAGPAQGLSWGTSETVSPQRFEKGILGVGNSLAFSLHKG